MNSSAGQAAETNRRIPTLDGWRGIAIMLVLFDHIQDSLLNRYLRPWTQTGQHGVTIFFVLSGFLITSKLLEGPINLKHFYLRRFFRLMPAAWAFLCALVLLDLLTGAHIVTLAGLSACVFFYRNFAQNVGSPVTGHFWSLSLEEQFYMVWPCVLLLAGARRCRWIAATGAIACASYRWFFWAYYNHNLMNNQTQVRADAPLIGCLLALLLADDRIRAIITRWSKFCALPAFVVLHSAVRVVAAVLRMPCHLHSYCGNDASSRFNNFAPFFPSPNCVAWSRLLQRVSMAGDIYGLPKPLDAFPWSAVFGAKQLLPHRTPLDTIGASADKYT
jgi:peptidoglycan/LPS O-acetylase OafA/YrhL